MIAAPVITPLVIPGIHPGLTRERYDAIEAINQSRLKSILRSPAHYIHDRDNPRERTPAMQFGEAVHRACLEPAWFDATVIPMPRFDRRTKDGKAAAEAFEEQAVGKLALPQDDYTRLHDCQRAVLAHPAASQLLALPGDREATVLWRDADTGTTCKARLDILTHNRGGIIDIKTTSNASPGAFARAIDQFGYDFQAAFYMAGVAACHGSPPDWYGLIAVESEPPHAVAVYEVGAPTLERGRLLWRKALDAYAACKKSGEWPGYSDRIEPIDVPAWALKSMGIEQEDRYELSA